MLNEEVVDSLQKVNVNLVFYGDNVTISIQRDKTIDLIQRTAYDYFKPHGKIKLYYKNKELTPYLNYTIAKYFQKLKKIDILVKDTAIMDSNLDNQFIINSKLSINEITNNYNNNVLNDDISTKNGNNKNKQILTQNQRANSYCWDCKKFPINMFCRDCCAFICKYCRMDIENAHYSHRTITLYPENLAKSANLYKNVLIEDLNEVQKVNKNAKKIAKDNSEINIDIDAYKKHLFEKVNRLLNKIKQIKSYQKEINYYINNKDKCKEKINKAIQDIKSISNEYNNKKANEINEEDSNNNSNDKKKNSNIGDLKDYFTRMNNIEKNTQKICNVGKTIEEWEDVNSKLEIALKTVENKIYSIITEAMNDESYKINNDGHSESNYNNFNDNKSNFENNKHKEKGDEIEKIEEEEENVQIEQKEENKNIEENKPVEKEQEEEKESANTHNKGDKEDNKVEKTPEIVQDVGEKEKEGNKVENKPKEEQGQIQENPEGDKGGDEEYEEIEEEVEEEIEQ